MCNYKYIYIYVYIDSYIVYFKINTDYSIASQENNNNMMKDSIKSISL